ncbi:hypothetical protein [Fictibacillus sp. 18YEL24]|uniref:hypothetical protein n=1 Tax=Fictibacillus sp. 18YEL24 TaxID=2745875 RepID=UPI0018CCC14E|nr:hypothetical protein [Fictibacillus sp. 18YEL24]MBH0171437.1 hypothetical protein [Fictibacillus sp. 18YEL24]
MNILPIIIAAAVSATVVTAFSESLVSWERITLSLGSFFITISIIKVVQKVRDNK